MRIVSFNIWLGGQDRWPGVLGVIRTLAPDVLVLQECTDWERDRRRFEEVGEALGAPHAVLGVGGREHEGRRFDVAVFSRVPLTGVKVHNDGRFMERAVVECQVAGFTLLGAHLTASSENERFVEMHWLTRVAVEVDAHRPMLLTGDLNSLSRRDPYPNTLADDLRKAGIEKYGDPPRFDVTDALGRQGWIDTLWLRGEPSAWVTAPREKNGVRVDTRLDYALVTAPLLRRVSRSWVHTLASGESDHHPIVIELT